MIEQEISRLKVKHGDLSPIGGKSGWPSHSLWESLKTPSHFNLAIALELRLKCLLRLEDFEPPQGRDGHSRAKLYDSFDTHGKSTQAELKRLFGKATTEYPFELVAFFSAHDPDIPEGPDDRQLQSLKDFPAYMDEDMELWKRRYAWEHASDGQWQHYINDLTAFFKFLDVTESIAMEMARKWGIVSWLSGSIDRWFPVCVDLAWRTAGVAVRC